MLFLYFFKNYKKYCVRILILLIISYLFISNIYARPPARFYLDPLLWITFIFLKENIIIKNKFIKIIFILQISAAIIVIWMSIYNLLPGSFSQQNRHKVLSNFADGYPLVNWANSILPKDLSVIINHRSSYFIDNEFVSLTFLPFVNSVELKYYLNYILNKNPQFFLTYGFNDEPQLGLLKNCLGDLLYKSKKVGKIATRNFLKSSEYYDGYIYQVEYRKLEDCVK